MKGVGCLNSHRTTLHHWFILRGRSRWPRIHFANMGYITVSLVGRIAMGSSNWESPDFVTHATCSHTHAAQHNLVKQIKSKIWESRPLIKLARMQIPDSVLLLTFNMHISEMFKEMHMQGVVNRRTWEENKPRGQNLQHDFSLWLMPSLIQKEGSMCSQYPSSWSLYQKSPGSTHSTQHQRKNQLQKS